MRLMGNKPRSRGTKFHTAPFGESLRTAGLLRGQNLLLPRRSIDRRFTPIIRNRLVGPHMSMRFVVTSETLSANSSTGLLVWKRLD